MLQSFIFALVLLNSVFAFHSSKRFASVKDTVGVGASTASKSSADDGMKWFVKTEVFCEPFPVVKPHLEAHRTWVKELRSLEAAGNGGATITSGYRLGADGKPGGGGLMFFRAQDRTAAEALVKNDPLVVNECVNYQLNEWVAEVGEIKVI